MWCHCTLHCMCGWKVEQVWAPHIANISLWVVNAVYKVTNQRPIDDLLFCCCMGMGIFSFPAVNRSIPLCCPTYHGGTTGPDSPDSVCLNKEKNSASVAVTKYNTTQTWTCSSSLFSSPVIIDFGPSIITSLGGSPLLKELLSGDRATSLILCISMHAIYPKLLLMSCSMLQASLIPRRPAWLFSCSRPLPVSVGTYWMV